MRKPWTRRALGLGIAGVIIVSTGSALAVTAQDTGGAVNKVIVRSESVNYVKSDDVYKDVPQATVNVTVPAGQQALLLIRFSAEVKCNTAGVGDACTLRILVNNAATKPAATDRPRISANGQSGTESIERHLVVGGGTHAVKVQMKNIDGSPANTNSMSVGVYTLVVQRISFP